MYEDFQEQRLNQPWNFKLEDYLPKPEPQSSAITCATTA